MSAELKSGKRRLITRIAVGGAIVLVGAEGVNAGQTVLAPSHPSAIQVLNSQRRTAFNEFEGILNRDTRLSSLIPPQTDAQLAQDFTSQTINKSDGIRGTEKIYTFRLNTRSSNTLGTDPAITVFDIKTQGAVQGETILVDGSFAEGPNGHLQFENRQPARNAVDTALQAPLFTAKQVEDALNGIMKGPPLKQWTYANGGNTFIANNTGRGESFPKVALGDRWGNWRMEITRPASNTRNQRHTLYLRKQ